MCFEKDLPNIIAKTKTTPFRSDFQKELKNCVREIKSETNMLVCADKTTNIYKVSKQTYQKLLSENIEKDYKKSTATKVEQINNEAKSIACRLELGDRIYNNICVGRTLYVCVFVCLCIQIKKSSQPI